MAGDSLQRDEVDDILDFWCHENSELDPVTKGLAMRLRRAGHLVERALRQELTELGVETWELEMLMALRRAPDTCRSAGELTREAQVTSGAVTNRLDRLEARRLIRRETDPSDRRQVLVSLTAEGRAHAERLIMAKTQAETRCFAGVDRALAERLSGDLRTLLASLQPGSCPEA